MSRLKYVMELSGGLVYFDLINVILGILMVIIGLCMNKMCKDKSTRIGKIIFIIGLIYFVASLAYIKGQLDIAGYIN